MKASFIAISTQEMSHFMPVGVMLQVIFAIMHDIGIIGLMPMPLIGIIEPIPGTIIGIMVMVGIAGVIADLLIP